MWGDLHHGGARRGDQAENLPLENVTQTDAAELLNVSDRSVRSGRRVREHGAPELIQAVESGEVPRSETFTERDQNPTELAALGLALEELERPDARRRQSEGGRIGGKGGKQASENFTEASGPTGNTRDIVASALGVSGPCARGGDQGASLHLEETRKVCRLFGGSGVCPNCVPRGGEKRQKPKETRRRRIQKARNHARFARYGLPPGVVGEHREDDAHEKGRRVQSAVAAALIVLFA